mmetsp:Transcript_36913/g.118320  ORF Transcript_36913/g.118320 Transcript_36913/m.118320 type:complete len:370 (+) Transcript_36913:718-1827(+)
MGAGVGHRRVGPGAPADEEDALLLVDGREAVEDRGDRPGDVVQRRLRRLEEHRLVVRDPRRRVDVVRRRRRRRQDEVQSLRQGVQPRPLGRRRRRSPGRRRQPRSSTCWERPCWPRRRKKEAPRGRLGPGVVAVVVEEDHRSRGLRRQGRQERQLVDLFVAVRAGQRADSAFPPALALGFHLGAVDLLAVFEGPDPRLSDDGASAGRGGGGGASARRRRRRAGGCVVSHHVGVVVRGLGLLHGGEGFGGVAEGRQRRVGPRDVAGASVPRRGRRSAADREDLRRTDGTGVQLRPDAGRVAVVVVLLGRLFFVVGDAEGQGEEQDHEDHASETQHPPQHLPPVRRRRLHQFHGVGVLHESSLGRRRRRNR